MDKPPIHTPKFNLSKHENNFMGLPSFSSPHTSSHVIYGSQWSYSKRYSLNPSKLMLARTESESLLSRSRIATLLKPRTMYLKAINL